MNKTKRLLELDALRGIAAIGVVLFHYMVAFADQYDNPSEIFSVLRYFRYGKHGVELFFILSGFVILMSLERTKKSSDFIFGRFVRLYPTYWTSVILSFIVIKIAGLPNLYVDIKDALINLTMFQEFLNIPHIDGNYWTLEIELSFYIIMLFLHTTKCLKKIDIVAIAWLLLISANFLLEKSQSFLVDSRIKTFLVLDHANLFVIGMLLYSIFFNHKTSVKIYLIIIACILFSLLKYGPEQFLFVLLFTTVFIFILKGKLNCLNQKYILFLGTISYSLYLTHLNLGIVIIKTLENVGVNLNIGILVATIVSIAVATIVTFLIEKPAMSFMKEKYSFFQSKRI